MQHQGTVMRWLDEKGFGFIQVGDDPSRQLFFHISDYQHTERPAIGEVVIFEIGQGRDTKPCAIHVRPYALMAVKQTWQKNPQRQTQFAVKTQVLKTWAIVGTVFIGLLIIAVIKFKLPWWMVGWYLAINLATFLLYAHDKKASKNNSWRVQEATLHKLALAGGWIGAAFAQWLLRHKSTKPTFRKNFYITVLGNIIGLMIVCAMKFRQF